MNKEIFLSLEISRKDLILLRLLDMKKQSMQAANSSSSSIQDR